MINSIISAVCTAINAGFNATADTYRIYKEPREQGLYTPCFFVKMIQPGSNQFLGRRHFRHYPLAVTYFPLSEQAPEAEGQAVAENLLSLLEYITVDAGLIRGTNMSYRMSDGVLVFLVQYDFYIYQAYTPDSMTSMEGETNVS